MVIGSPLINMATLYFWPVLLDASKGKGEGDQKDRGPNHLSHQIHNVFSFLTTNYRVWVTCRLHNRNEVWVETNSNCHKQLVTSCVSTNSAERRNPPESAKAPRRPSRWQKRRRKSPLRSGAAHLKATDPTEKQLAARSWSLSLDSQNENSFWRKTEVCKWRNRS